MFLLLFGFPWGNGNPQDFDNIILWSGITPDQAFLRVDSTECGTFYLSGTLHLTRKTQISHVQCSTNESVCLCPERTQQVIIHLFFCFLFSVIFILFVITLKLVHHLHLYGLSTFLIDIENLCVVFKFLLIQSTRNCTV